MKTKHLLKTLALSLILLMAGKVGWGQLIISQYIETSSGTTPKGIELWNNSGSDIDFSSTNLEIRKGTNGAVPTTIVTISSGTLPNGSVYVIGTAADVSGTGTGFKDFVENNGATFYTYNFTFNGDDALEIWLGGVKQDVFGNPGQDPGSYWSGNGVQTANQNISIKTGVLTGDTDGWTDPSERFEVTTTDNSLTGFGQAPINDTQAPQVTFNPLDASTNVEPTVTPTISFDEAIRNIDDSEITDANVASLLTFKETDASGANVPFTATISTDKKIITITPASNLNFSQVYYLAIASVEDESDNATTAQSITFTTRAASTDATVSSAVYTVDNVAETITNVPSSETLANFKANITPAAGATFEVYQADGTTVATDLQTGYKLICTAEDGVTQKTYTITLNATLSNDATVSSVVYTVDNNAETITNVPWDETLTNFKSNITPATGATFEVYQADGTTVATDLQTGYKLICTAQDGTTTKTYTITLNTPSATAILYEPFDYTAGSVLQTQTGWNPLNQGDDIQIVAGNLTYPGLAASVGNKIAFAGNGIDTYNEFDSDGITSGKVFYSFILKVTDLTAATEALGGYFIGFAADNTTFGATVWTKRIDDNSYQIGLNSRTNTSNTQFTTDSYSKDAEVFIVASYEVVDGAGNDVANIWINPASQYLEAAAEPTPTLTITNTGGTDLASVKRIFIRQDSNSETPAIELDELRVGYTWAQVTPLGTLSSDATVTSTVYTVDSNAGTITNVPQTETLANFKANITPAAGATFEVYQDDGITVASDLQTGYKLICTAQDGVTTKTYTIILNTTLSSEKAILSYSINGVNGTIDTVNHTVTLTLPFGTDRSSLVATFTLSAAATAKVGTTPQVSGVTANDFTNPVTYTVTAEDSTTQDWVVTVNLEEIPLTKIYDIQFTTDPSGDSPLKGQQVRTKGVVTAVKPSTSSFNMWLQDSAKAWNGVYVYGVSNTLGAVAQGDSVEVVGTVDEYNNLTEIKSVSYLKVINSGNTLPDPVEVTIPEAASEAYEGVLVKLSNVVCTVANAGYGEFTVSDGTNTINVDDFIYKFTPTQDARYNITGVIYYSFSKFKLLPRSESDIENVDIKYNVTFNVKRTDGTTAVEGATINVTGQGSVTTDANGTATMQLPNGDYTYTVVKTDFNTYNGTFTVSDADLAVDITLVATGVPTNPIAKLSVYPNPFTDRIYFTGSEVSRVVITSVIGQVVMDRQVENTESIDVSSIERGIYLVRFYNSKGESVLRKLVKEE